MNPAQSNYGWGLPVAASTYADKIDRSLLILHAAMAAIFVLWAVYMAYCLVRYRKENSPKAVYSHKSTLASYTPDVLIFIFEVWLIFIVGVPIWAHIREELPAPEDATVIRVVAEQFAWLAHYPGPDGKFGRMAPSLVDYANPLGLDPQDPDAGDDVASVNEIRVPLGRPVLVTLTARDVIHSFFVPEFRTKQDAVPGMENSIWFEPVMAGRFEIGCAQLCGLGHYLMRGDIFVLPEDEYAAWMAGEQAGRRP